MKKLAILISVLLFTLVSLFFFVSLKPSPIFAAPCSFAINDRNLTRNGTLVVGLQTGTVGKDYLVRLIVKNITINSPEWVLDNYDLKNVSGFPTAFAAKISDLGIISS